MNRGQTSAPSDIFRTKDGWIIAYAIGNPMFARWAKLLGEDDWLTDPRFKDDESRGNHGEIISKHVSEWTGARTTVEALAALESAKIPAGPLYSPRQALEDAHIRAAGLLRTPSIPGCRARSRSRRRPSISRRARAASATARRRSTSTPTPSSASSATTAPRSTGSAPAA